MIQAKELRIGNLFTAGNNVEYISVLNINFKRPDSFIINEHIPLSHLHPIPLSEEVLVKCGFMKDQLGYYHPDSNFKLYSNKRGLLPCWNENVSSDVYIKDLHRLQNAYYVFTNTELTYTP